MDMMKIVDMAMIRAVARCPWPDSSVGIKERRINGFEGPLLQATAPTGRANHRNASEEHPRPKDLALQSRVDFPHTAHGVYVHCTWKIRMQNKQSFLRGLEAHEQVSILGESRHSQAKGHPSG